MNKSRRLSLLSMFANLTVIVLGIMGVYYFASTTTFQVESLKYYDVLTILVTFLGAALMIWANIVSFAKRKDCTPRLFYTIRFLSAVMSLITLIVAFISPDKGDIANIFTLESGNLFLTFICPIVSILQFICLEIEPKAKFKKTFEPFVATIIYAAAMLITVFVILKTKGATDAASFANPYSFYLVTQDLIDAAGDWAKDTTVVRNICTLVAIIFIIYAAGVILWLLNRISHNIFIGEVYEIDAPKAKGGDLTLEGEDKSFAGYVKRKVAFGDNKPASSGQTYHISYHDRKLKTWKVKTENAGRALKVFPTQKEAIDFAKSCVKKNGGSIRVHSMIGRIRKE